MNQPLAVGIDIGGTNTAFGIVDRRGNTLTEGSIRTTGHKDISHYTDELYKALMPLIDEVEGEVIGIGVGAPNGNYYNGTIEYAANLPWKEVIPLANMLKEQFSLPVQITNDANAAAVGEMTYGVAKGMKNFIMITLGTGLGSGIVVNGNIVFGHDGFAGELGHVVVEKEGRACGCGRYGCLETYSSATGLVRTMKEFLQSKKTDSLFRAMPTEEITSKNIAIAAQNGDKLALDAMDYTAEILGRALANFTAFSAPEAFILFGGLALAGDILFEPTKRYMNENTLKVWKDKVKILPSDLDEGDAAILGASALVWEMQD